MSGWCYLADHPQRQGDENLKAARTILGSTWFIHSMIPLGLLALWGFIESDIKYSLLCVFLSFSGATCGSFIRVLDAIRAEKQGAPLDGRR